MKKDEALETEVEHATRKLLYWSRRLETARRRLKSYRRGVEKRELIGYTFPDEPLAGSTAERLVEKIEAGTL